MARRANGDHVSFIVRFWLEEDAGRRFWRARVVEVAGERDAHVEDGRALLGFMSAHLASVSGVEFPNERTGVAQPGEED